MIKFDKEKFQRMEKMLTRAEIAEKLGITPQAVSNRMGKNIDNIRLREFLAICELMQMHPTEFLIAQSED